MDLALYNIRVFMNTESHQLAVYELGGIADNSYRMHITDDYRLKGSNFYTANLKQYGYLNLIDIVYAIKMGVHSLLNNEKKDYTTKSLYNGVMPENPTPFLYNLKSW